MNTKTEYPIGTLFWLIHHGCLLEPLQEPLQNRIDYINTQKPSNERETRLKWMRPVISPARLPEAVRLAWMDWRNANNEAQSAIDCYSEAQDKYFESDGVTGPERDKEIKAYRDTYEVRNLALDKRTDAWMRWKGETYEHSEEIKALHMLECPGCPFDYFGAFGELQFYK